MEQSASPTPSSTTKQDKVKRGYRACLHCRSRKAKCDLGDIDAPSEPPCTRCRRESRECVFAPSRRGGNNGKRKLKAESLDPPPPPSNPYAPFTSMQQLLQPSPTHLTDSTPTKSPIQPSPSPKRRRLHLHPPVNAADPSSLVVADMQNESDALHILALASQQGGESVPAFGKQTVLEDFPLIKLGIVSADQVIRLTDVFFRCIHHLMPIIPSKLIPRSREGLATFAQSERYLLAAMVIIASRHDTSQNMRHVHDRSWAVMRGWISDIQCLGAPPTVGLVEALLLLAENLPRDPVRSQNRHEPDEMRAIGVGEESHSAENRQAWMLIGTAIRSAYGLGIDKLAFMLFPEAERSEELERARLAFTYCYLFDRHVSLRLGKGFWSRGPAICFQGFSSSAQTGPATATANFPTLREIRDGDYPQEDYAALVQAYLELTQMMSSAHDTLYPNAARTRSLVVYGEYFKYLDELARSLDGFKILWSKKKWNLFPLNDVVWCQFYYTQLYICAFSFQAHVERAALRADDEYQRLEQQHKASGSTAELPRPPLSLFPRGTAASPDARYILQCNDAARALLHICTDSLAPGGALPYLPSRYLLWFTYAAIVLLKALYSGAMIRADHAETLNLIDRLCSCFAQTSSDEDHPAGRYSKQIKALRHKLSALSAGTAPNSPAGGHVVPLPPMAAYEPISASPAWQLPVPSQTQVPISFAYPSTPSLPFVAPPHQQPFSDINHLNPQEVPSAANNLGFATLDDWFGSENDAAMFGGLDLQDFWRAIGPGEAQGGFPFK